MERRKGIAVRESDLPWERRSDPALYAKSPTRWKLLVAGERTASRGLTVGIAEIPPGKSLILHHHAPQEVYYVLHGQGRTEIDAEAFELQPGTALFIPPNARHRTRNTGREPLRFLWIFPTDTFRDIEYHFDE
jgi:mannose-6-phosphate isomerase-like protein (cupin superfamily)